MNGVNGKFKRIRDFYGYKRIHNGFKDSLGNRGIHVELVPDFNGCPSLD